MDTHTAEQPRAGEYQLDSSPLAYAAPTAIMRNRQGERGIPRKPMDAQIVEHTTMFLPSVPIREHPTAQRQQILNKLYDLFILASTAGAS